MERVTFPANRNIYLLLLALVAVLLVIMPRGGKFNYDYKKGSPWAYETLVSQFDFPILKTDEQIQSEMDAAGSSVIPYYRYSEQVVTQAMKSADEISLAGHENLRPILSRSLNFIYTRGVMPDMTKDNKNNTNVILVQRDKRATRLPIEDVYTVSSATSKLISDIKRAYPRNDADSLITATGMLDIITPNLFYDKESTDLVHAQSVDYISTTQGFVTAGQTIVSSGEIITSEVEQMLDSYKKEFESSMSYSGPKVFLWLGNAIIAFVIVLLLLLSLMYSANEVFRDPKEFYYIVFIVALAAVLTFIFEKLNTRLLYLMPFPVFAMYLQAFFSKRVVIPVYTVLLLPLLIFAHDGTELFTIFMAGGFVAVFSYEYFNKGWSQFITAFIIFAVEALAYLGFKFINDIQGFTGMGKMAFLLIGALISVAVYQFVYLFEKIFSLVSRQRLADLCDTNNPLLVNLSHKAPGTFQHSLQVMNMSEAAARSIGADVTLARAGALYHDIGKSVNPLCFIENQTTALGKDYHEHLSYEQSSHDIISHVSDGIELAKKGGLPGIVQDFITSHHGTSITGYFYNKYVNEGGDPDNVAPFQYKGHKPTTKEQSIVMLCDSLEAASRSLKDTTPEAFDKFVDNMVASKSRQGQFDDSDLTLKELEIIKKVLKDYLRQIYHERIEYPKRER
ncbi:MAG: HDIG domain-containing protein [Bacteroidales bacterium]|nr:HDIG domain-containing protein [Bacteroidales bacterium]